MSETTLRIQRRDGDLLALEAGPIAELFFSQPITSGYQRASISTRPDAILWRDIDLINSYMGARSPNRVWQPLVGKRPRWLTNINPRLDLIRASPHTWKAVGGDDLIRKALLACVGPGRNIAVATKLLHLKRPRLFPILDRVVVELLGERFGVKSEADARAGDAANLILHLRDEGRANLPALRETQARVNAVTQQRVPLIRILEAVLWASNPSAGGSWLGDRRRAFHCWLD